MTARLLVDVLGPVFLVLSGVLAGVLVGVELAVVPALAALPGDRYLQVHRLIDPRFDPVMPRLSQVALGAGIVVTVAVPGLAAKLAGGFAVLSIIAVAAVSEAHNVRMNRHMDTWNAEHLPTGWESLRTRWGRWHRVRTAASIAGFIAAASVPFLRG